MAEETLISLFHKMVAKKGDQTALRYKDLGIWHPVSWNQFYQRVKNFLFGLECLGLKEKDKVAILADPCPEWVYAELAIQTARAIVVGVYATSPPAQIHYLLEHSGSRFIIVEDQEQADKVLEIKDKLPRLERIIYIDPKGLRHYDDPLLIEFEKVNALGREAGTVDPHRYEGLVGAVKADDVAMLIYTSGTTGYPKGAMITHRNIVAMVEAMVEVTGLDDKDAVVSYLPLCHIAEQIFSVFIQMKVGATCNFSESIETVNENIREISPTVFLGVPRIWEKTQSDILLKVRRSTWLKRQLFNLLIIPGRKAAQARFSGKRVGFGWRTLNLVAYFGLYRTLQDRLGLLRSKLLISGAAAISPDVLLFFHSIGLEVVQAYGMTETSGLTFIHQGGRIKLETVGQPIPGVFFKLAEDGEILKKGDSIFSGYYKDPEATAEVLQDGWLHTGDIGKIDEDGHLKIVDRKKDLIVTPGGKNIAPQYIENKLKFSPYINEAMVVGEGRKFVAALIQIELEMTSQWAMDKNISFTTYSDLAGKPEIQDLIAEEVRAVNATLSRVERVKKFLILDKMLDHDDDELTATMKIKRKKVHELYREKIEDLYRNGHDV